MECPKCKRDVDTLHGHGKYPNDTYQCNYCYSEDTTIAVAGFFKAVLIVVGLLFWVRVAELLIRS